MPQWEIQGIIPARFGCSKVWISSYVAYIATVKYIIDLKFQKTFPFGEREAMLLQEIKNIFHKELDTIYGKEEVSSFFYLLIEHCLGLERFALVIEPNLIIDKNRETPLFKALSELKQEKPIQHIIGHAYFMDLELKVCPAVLIPRPETEELVRWILKDVKGVADPLTILDIGTGSGCIPIALAKKLEYASVKALDISIDALKIAKKNAEANKVKVDFFQKDIRDASAPTNTLNVLEPKFNIIVSNPPYVRNLEKRAIQNNVKLYEPDLALFVPDNDPLIFYRTIAVFAQQHLVANGSLYLEINQYLAKETMALLENYNFGNIESKKDMFGDDRMIKAKK